ncbi:MAG TPA: YecR family lipoprotein [Steroidobacteraceae bacterium]|nr:YecR family lipoprotein [Steroidobacteraceae bacterium]
MKRLMLVGCFTLLASCTTYKLWNEAGSDQDERTVDLSYEYGKFENPQLDERAGLEMARERCKDWGFPIARRKGESRDCLDGTRESCGRWRVTRQYQCAAPAK